MLVCHGNAGSIEQRIETARVFLGRGWSVLLFDYRGYGKNAGSPGEEGTCRDAEAAYDHLGRRGFAPERIALYGESLGAAVAFELVRRRPVGGVIAESAFTSLPDVGAEVYPFLPVRWLACFRHDRSWATKDLGARAPRRADHAAEEESIEHPERFPLSSRLELRRKSKKTRARR